MNNLIGHFDSARSDKLYIAAVRDNQDGTWSMVGKWGRVGGTMREKIRFTGTYQQAIRAQENTFERKIEKGYVNIESPHYGGHLTLTNHAVERNLEPEDVPNEANERAARKAEGMARIANAKSHTETAEKLEEIFEEDSGESEEEAVEEVKAKEPEDIVVICKDNHGVESQFTVGVEYLADEINAEFVHAWNKFGELTTLDKDRFERT